jgi:hypothetical protein
MFCYGDTNDLCIIGAIDEGFAMCEYLEEDLPPFFISTQFCPLDI